MSRVYGKMFQTLQELMQDDEKFQELTPLDYSALGMYMGKFVEQEINSSVVQIMREFCGIEMPEYYCKFYPKYDADTDIEFKNKKIRLNEHKNPQAPQDALRSIALGDAYYALKQLMEEDCDGFFNSYPWLNDKRFLESWRKLFGYRNRMAHIGEIINADTLKDNYKQFLVFLEFMPDILDAKKKLAPEGYIEVLPPTPKKEETYRPYFISTDPTEKPYAPQHIAKLYCELSEQEKKLENYDFDIAEKKNEIKDKFSLETIVFEGPNGKQGLKDCLGNILVPAKYDGFGFKHNPFDYKRNGVIAVSNGRYVVVTLDGTGTELTKETYDEIRLATYNNPHSPYIFRKNDLSAWGLMNYMGEELSECIADSFSDDFDCAYYSSGDLWGYWEFYYKTLTPPIYDNIETDGEMDGFLIFTLNGEKGYVKYDGTFVPFAELNKLDEDAQWDIKCECIIDRHLSTY